MNALQKAYRRYDGQIRAAIACIDEFASLSNWQKTEIATRMSYIFIPMTEPHRRLLLIALEKVIMSRYPEETYYQFQQRNLLSRLNAIGDIPF